jgi:hypothetical protein
VPHLWLHVGVFCLCIDGNLLFSFICSLQRLDITTVLQSNLINQYTIVTNDELPPFGCLVICFINYASEFEEGHKLCIL